jgi:hypothetical protein
VSTGLILGMAQKIDAAGHVVADDERVLRNSNAYLGFRQPLYSCAIAPKASIQTVRFRMSGASSLHNVEVLDVSPKTYQSEEDLPYWAVEKSTAWIEDVNPIWGMVSQEYAESKDLETVQSREFYLPAGGIYSMIKSMGWSDSLAGVDVPGAVAGLIFGRVDDHHSGPSVTSLDSMLPDYSGKDSGTLAWRWNELNSNASLAAHIPGLIWTDIMANAVVGAKGLMPGEKSSEKLQYPTVHLEAVIRFHYVYGIPAFIFLGLFVALLLAACVVLIRGFRLETLRDLLNHTSAGRVALTERFPQKIPVDLKTKDWRAEYGHERMLIAKKELLPKKSSVETGSTSLVSSELSSLRDLKSKFGKWNGSHDIKECASDT